MKPTKKKVAAELKRIRNIIDTSSCPFETKIAYAVEQGIRWSTQETIGWPKPHKDILDGAKDLKREMKRVDFCYPA